MHLLYTLTIGVLLISGCLGQQGGSSSTSAPDPSTTEATKDGSSTPQPSRNPSTTGGNAVTGPVDCATLCPSSSPGESTSTSAQAGATPGTSPSSTSGASSGSCPANITSLNDGLSQLLNPPELPTAVDVMVDHMSNLIFSLRSANSKIFVAAIKSNNTVVPWQSLNISDADEYAISTASGSDKIHVVAKAGIVLKHCEFDLGSTCQTWTSIDILSMIDANSVTVPLTVIKEGTLNLVEHPGRNLALSWLGSRDANATQAPFQIFVAHYVGNNRWFGRTIHGRDWDRDLKMIHIPMLYHQNNNVNIPGGLTLAPIHNTNSLIHHTFAYDKTVFVSASNTVGQDPSWSGISSLDTPNSTDDSATTIGDLVYQQSFPGLDIFGINGNGNILHIWQRAHISVSGGTPIKMESSDPAVTISAVYSRKFKKTFVAAIKKESQQPVIYKAIDANPESAENGNKIPPGSGSWQQLNGFFSLLDIAASHHGVVGIVYEPSVSGSSGHLRFIVCETDISCSWIQ